MNKSQWDDVVIFIVLKFPLVLFWYHNISQRPITMKAVSIMPFNTQDLLLQIESRAFIVECNQQNLSRTLFKYLSTICMFTCLDGGSGSYS